MSIIHLQPTVADAIQHHMSQIAKLFDNPKYALVIRLAPPDDGTIILTNDDPGDTIAAIRAMTNLHDSPVVIRSN
jgi:hypothetical protein